MSGIDREAIRDCVRDFILLEFLPAENPEALKDSTPLISGGILDSISIFRVVSHLEDRFGVSLEQQDITVNRFDTVEGIIQTVEQKLQGSVS